VVAQRVFNQNLSLTDIDRLVRVLEQGVNNLNLVAKKREFMRDLM